MDELPTLVLLPIPTLVVEREGGRGWLLSTGDVPLSLLPGLRELRKVMDDDSADITPEDDPEADLSPV